jgi:vacuolar-type H+-ATPase subunit E/Vma4
MALPDLIARLERDAETRGDELDRQANAEAEALRAEASRLLVQRREQELTRRRTERRVRHEAALAEARRGARGARLTAQHALLERIFARARALLPEVASSAEYFALLPAHYAEARRYVEGVKLTVRCHPSSAIWLHGTDADATFVEDAQAAPGVYVSAADGSVFIDNTLPARMQRLEAKLAVELLAEVTS